MRGQKQWVSASEIGKYVYCARQYWLFEVQGVRPGRKTSGRLRQGVKAHHRHGVLHDWQLRFHRWAITLLGLALLGGLLYYLVTSAGQS